MIPTSKTCVVVWFLPARLLLSWDSYQQNFCCRMIPTSKASLHDFYQQSFCWRMIPTSKNFLTYHDCLILTFDVCDFWHRPHQRFLWLQALVRFFEPCTSSELPRSWELVFYEFLYIIITTRLPEIAKVYGTIKPHFQVGLPDLYLENSLTHIVACFIGRAQPGYWSCFIYTYIYYYY